MQVKLARSRAALMVDWKDDEWIEPLMTRRLSPRCFVVSGLQNSMARACNAGDRCSAPAPLPRHYEWCSKVVRCCPRPEVVMSTTAANHIILFQPPGPTSWPKLLTRRVPSSSVIPSGLSSFFERKPLGT